MKGKTKKKVNPKPEGYIFGRPTKYRPEYCQSIIDYFSIEPNYEQELNHYKNGEVNFVDKKVKANKLPTFHGFAATIGLTDTKTMLDWCKIHPDFCHSYARAKELQKHFIAENALNGAYNANFSQFLLHNISDWKIKQEKEQEGQINITLMLPPNERDQRKAIDQGKIIEIEGETVTDSE
jgi:hypothetical protein